MTYLYWILTGLYVVVTVGTMVKMLMDDHEPMKALAWLLVLLFVPVVGVVAYIVFGRNTRKEHYISKRSLDMITRRSMLSSAGGPAPQLPGRYRQLIHLLTQQGGTTPTAGNKVEIFTNGADFIRSLLAAIGSARHHIHLASYIIDDDALGRLVADALIDKARQGVTVRVIYDDVGSWKSGKAFFERMRDGGIDIHAFMPVKFPAFTSKINYRNHRKLCIVDGLVGYIGGMNIALRYIKGTRRLGPWRDTHLRITGNAVSGLQSAFLVDWYFVDRTLINDKEYHPRPKPAATAGADSAAGCLAQIVTSSPTSPYPEMMQAYVRILSQAREYVYIETPYFLPTEPVLFAMRMAAQSGVDVRLMLPLRADSRIVEWASRSYVSTIEAAGVKVLFYKGGFNHSKILISDDGLCTCGSTNIDFRSFNNNFEVNALFYDEPMALRMKEVFEADERQCISLSEVPQMLKRPFFRHLWESVVRLFAPLL